MPELDLKTECKFEGPLVSAPEFDYTDKGQARCRLTFPKKCSGQGEVNKKPYWVQVCAFGALAEQAARLSVGSNVVSYSRLNVNRWEPEAQPGVVKTSTNYIAYRIGVIRGIGEDVAWLPGAPRKAKAKEKVDEVPEVPKLQTDNESQIDEFVHGQAAPLVPGEDAERELPDDDRDIPD